MVHCQFWKAKQKRKRKKCSGCMTSSLNEFFYSWRRREFCPSSSTGGFTSTLLNKKAMKVQTTKPIAPMIKLVRIDVMMKAKTAGAHPTIG